MRELLTMQGQVTHAALRAGPHDDDTWLHTERDLDSIAPPLTRIMNRYDALRAAAAAGDEVLLVAAVSRYGFTNYTKRRRLLAQLAAEGPQPLTGVPADPIPEPQPEWQPEPLAGDDAGAFAGPPDITPKGAHRR